MKIARSISVCAMVAAATATHAQQSFDHTACRAGSVTVLAQSEGLMVSSIDHRGVVRGNQPNDPFDGNTQRCIGYLVSVDGKAGGSGWCKNVDAKTGDWFMTEWTTEGKGAGGFAFRYGTGKFKGIAGNGTYEPTGMTRPVEPGTYQNCVRIKGTATFAG